MSVFMLYEHTVKFASRQDKNTVNTTNDICELPKANPHQGRRTWGFPREFSNATKNPLTHLQQVFVHV